MTTTTMELAAPTDESALVAVVYAADGVRFTASAESAEALTDRLADYVRERSDDVLWPDEAARVRALLAEGELPDAIDCYFWHVGGRWDREWLVTTCTAHLAMTPAR